MALYHRQLTPAHFPNRYKLVDPNGTLQAIMPSFRELEMQQMSIMHFIRKWRSSADTALTGMPVLPITSLKLKVSTKHVLQWQHFNGPDPTVDSKQIYYKTLRNCAHTTSRLCIDIGIHRLCIAMCTQSTTMVCTILCTVIEGVQLVRSALGWKSCTIAVHRKTD